MFWARRPRPGAVRGDGQGRLPGDQGRAAARRRRHRRDDRQQHGLHRAALRARRQGSFDAVGVHTDTACLTDGPDVYLPRRARPRRPLHVHRLPRGPRGDEPPRRRRQADLDDRAGLEHADDRAGLLQRRRVGRAEAARRHRGSSRPQFLTPGVPLPRRRPDRRRRALVRHRRTSRARRMPAASASTAATARPSRRPPRSGRSTAGSRRRPCGGVVDAERTADRDRPAARRAEVRRHDRHRRQGRRLAGRRRHRADQDVRRRQVRAHVRRRRTRSISPWWPSRYWKRGKHTLTFKAIDEANNVITKSVTVHKVKRLPKVTTSATLTARAPRRHEVKVDRRGQRAARRTRRRACAARPSSSSRSGCAGSASGRPPPVRRRADRPVASPSA